MIFGAGAVRRQRKPGCLDCAFSPATTALFTVLRQKLASASSNPAMAEKIRTEADYFEKMQSGCAILGFVANTCLLARE